MVEHLRSDPFSAGRFVQMPSLPVSVPGFEAFGLADLGLQTSLGGSLGVETRWAHALSVSVTGYAQRLRVTDVRISNNGSVVRVSTYGRGIWEIHPNSEPATANGTGDFDHNKVIDFFNMASLAARMGSTPAVTSNLVYDSAVDMDGNSTIDGADVAALVAKFGSTIP